MLHNERRQGNYSEAKPGTYFGHAKELLFDKSCLEANCGYSRFQNASKVVRGCELACAGYNHVSIALLSRRLPRPRELADVSFIRSGGLWRHQH